MGEHAEYKSSIRSRTLIKRAYVELLAEKESGRITVTDIVKRAEINRGTFYAHYQDTRAVAEQIEGEIGERLRALASCGVRGVYSEPRPFFRELTAFLSSNKKFYSALLFSKGAQPLLERLGALYDELLRDDQSVSEAMKRSPDFQARHIYVSAGIYNIYKAWLGGGLAVSDDELVSICAVLVASARPRDEAPPEKE